MARQLIIVVSLFLLGCYPKNVAPVENNRLESIVQEFHSTDLTKRMAAIDALHRLADEGLSEGEGLYALRIASESFPPLEYEFQDCGGELVSAAARKAYSSYAAEIETKFGSYSPIAQADALRLLGNLEDRQAAQVFLNVLDIVSGDTRIYVLGTLATKPRHSDVLFPAIVPYVHRPNLQWPVSEVVLAYLKAGLVDEDSKRRISPAMIAVHDDLQRILLPLQREQGEDWIWEDAYQEARSMAALALDILGYTGTDEARQELTESVAYKDPRLKMFAIVGLLRFGVVADATDYEQVAASAESRNWLYRDLAELNRLDLYPDRFMTQESFAESDMVNWLTYPTELAQVPDEIELMGVVPRTYSDGEGRFYVFRFRTFEPHWAAEDGWTAGVSGPFRSDDTPSPESYGGTFSDFMLWDECGAEEHVARIEKLLDESRQQAGN